MVQIFKHRCNQINDLKRCLPHWGVEIDLRSNVTEPGDLHLSHDPWNKGESLNTWLSAFVEFGIKGPIILNTKEDGLETLAIELLNLHGVHNYLFLDTSIPTFRKWTREKSNPRFFIRWSSIEPFEFAETNRGFCNWVWVDCFDRVPPDFEILESLAKSFKTCLVSPELQGGNEADANHFINLFSSKLSGVCTKFPELWESAAIKSSSLP